MDDIDAPQWADFTAPSPQISSDDFFFRRHNEHEYREKLDSVDSNVSNLSIKKQSLNESAFENDSFMHKTPIRVMSAKGVKKSASCKKNNLEETTHDSILIEAMSNLQLSFKKVDKSFNKSCLIDSPSFKTPVKRVTRSMCAQAVNTPKYNLEESHCTSPIHEKSKSKHDHSDDENENLNIQKHESPGNEQSSQIYLEFTASGSEHEISQDKFQDLSEPKSEPDLELKLESDSETKVEPDLDTTSKPDLEEKSQLNKISPNEQMHNSKHIQRSKVVTSFEQNNSGSGKKKLSALTGTAWHRQVKRRMSITNQKRLSIAKPQVSTKYVSMAEAISKFQRATPQRFRSTTVKTTKTEQLRRMSFKLTRATSPALMSKTRTRPVTALSREEQERLEMEKLRQNQIKANPLRKDILKKPAPLKKVVKKMVTNPEPFHLTETKKGQTMQKQNQEIKRAPRIVTKTVPTIVSTDDNGVVVKREEVLHFGIPLDPCKTKKKNTKVMPFSFEARNKELQQKKQEKLKVLQESEQQKAKAEFHARPVPAAVKTPLKPVKDISTHKPKITLTRSLSFEERVKQVQKKKEEKIKQMLEEEKKARSFKAQKVPEFKPVLVRGRSKDNLFKKSQENLATKPHNVSGCSNKKMDNSLKKSQENLAKKQPNIIKKPMIPFVAPKKTSPVSVTSENQENRPQGAVPKILEPKCKLSQKSVAVLSELNTDKRAKQRKEFEDQMKKKEMEEEEMKVKEEADRLAKEKAEKLELRKKTEIKARPMPTYKLLNIVKSTKPLTDAHSPAWASKRKGSMH